MPDPRKKTFVKVKKTTVADRQAYEDARANAMTGGRAVTKLVTPGIPPREDYDNLRASAVRGSGSGKERTIDRASEEEYAATRITYKKPKKKLS